MTKKKVEVDTDEEMAEIDEGEDTLSESSSIQPSDETVSDDSMDEDEKMDVVKKIRQSLTKMSANQVQNVRTKLSNRNTNERRQVR
jgi:hypothetical protein